MINKPVYFGESQEGSTPMAHTFITSEKTSKVYEHYLDYAIDDWGLARQLCTLLRGVEEHDGVIIRINSPGGRFDIAAQIVNAIRECQGSVVAVLEQECASAATLVFLACSQWQVQPWAEMMIHNASYGAWGKAHEVSSRVRSTDDRMSKVLREVYDGFLSEEEIEDVLKGQDIYLTAEDIESRLESVIEIRSQEDDEYEYVEETDQLSQVPEGSEE